MEMRQKTKRWVRQNRQRLSVEWPTVDCERRRQTEMFVYQVHLCIYQVHLCKLMLDSCWVAVCQSLWVVGRTLLFIDVFIMKLTWLQVQQRWEMLVIWTRYMLASGLSWFLSEMIDSLPAGMLDSTVTYLLTLLSVWMSATLQRYLSEGKGSIFHCTVAAACVIWA